MRMAKKETDNFASVLCCFTRTYVGLASNFCWESLLGGFHMRMAKQETENFASVWCCFTRTYFGLTPQFLLGKLAWGL